MLNTTIDLIRHGEPVGGRKYRGQTDDPLSDKGWQQMRSAVSEHKPWQHIVSSPLLRCSEFAQELSQRHQMPLTLDDSFKEIGFGVWEGNTADQIELKTPGALKKFYADPVHNQPEGAESLVRFRERVSKAMHDLLDVYKGKHILVVCHAGVIRMTMIHFLDIPLQNAFRIQVDNAGLTRISFEHTLEHDIPRLIFHGGRL